MIINSLLDTDFYKFTMWQAHKNYKYNASSQAEYELAFRNTTKFPLSEIADAISSEIDHLCSLSFRSDEIAYLKTRPQLKNDFVDFLSSFKYDRSCVEVSTRGDSLYVRASGKLIDTIGFETHVLAIVSELYGRECVERGLCDDWLKIGRKNLSRKIDWVDKFVHKNEQSWKVKTLGKSAFEFVDFGTRRRFSREWHDEVVATMAREAPSAFVGTSNVYLAKKYGVATVGTMAHEFLQAFQATSENLSDFQREALDAWVREYRGSPGVALTDVVGMDAFLRDFDLYFAKLFDGLRHDSGGPREWAKKAIAHYRNLGIDPSTKKLVFSDGLDLETCGDLWERFSGDAGLLFGIGTNLTNDVGVEPLGAVMKMVSFNYKPVAKISDSPGKTMAVDSDFVSKLSDTFGTGRPS